MATLSESFACLGVALAGIGLFSLLAYAVARWTNEIGTCMAPGATTGSVTGLVPRDVLGMVCAGFAPGHRWFFGADRWRRALSPI